MCCLHWWQKWWSVFSREDASQVMTQSKSHFRRLPPAFLTSGTYCLKNYKYLLKCTQLTKSKMIPHSLETLSTHLMCDPNRFAQTPIDDPKPDRGKPMHENLFFTQRGRFLGRAVDLRKRRVNVDYSKTSI